MTDEQAEAIVSAIEQLATAIATASDRQADALAGIDATLSEIDGTLIEMLTAK